MRAAPVRVIAPAPSPTASTLSKMQSEKEAQRARDRAAAIKKGSDWTGSRHCTARTEDELEVSHVFRPEPDQSDSLPQLLEAIEAEDARLQQIENVEVDAFQCWLVSPQSLSQSRQPNIGTSSAHAHEKATRLDRRQPGRGAEQLPLCEGRREGRREPGDPGEPSGGL